MTQQPDFWESKQGDGAPDQLPTKKKKKRHNPWGKDATANPENMSAGSGG